MKVKCDYCGNTYEDTQPKCPYCAGPNSSHQNTGNPKTIEELKEWYKARNLPAPEVTRFFIGEDYKKPKAFGIYKDYNGDFVVYKNKADGTRAVRYQGKDEEYAVNELLQTLKDEIVHQKNLNAMNRAGASSGGHGAPRPGGYGTIMSREEKARHREETKALRVMGIMWIITLALIVGAAMFYGRHTGYYQYNDTVYYNNSGDWYTYDTYWHRVRSDDLAPAVIEMNYDDYYLSGKWNSTINSSDWNNSSFARSSSSSGTRSGSNSSWTSSWSSDSSYDWGGSDSWDSGGTDWDSDW